jgi:hypothetical protein
MMSQGHVVMLITWLLAAGCAPSAVGGKVAGDTASDPGTPGGTAVDPPEGTTTGSANGDPSGAGGWRGDIQTGTALDDQIRGMALDADGNLYVAGYEGGTNHVTNIEPAGDARAIVAKYSAAGRLAWKTVIDTPGTDAAEGVAVDPVSGNLFVVGRTSGALPGFSNQGQFDSILAVLDPSGRVLSQAQMGNERPQHPLRVSVAGGNRIVVAGLDDTYVPSNFVQAPEDGFVANFRIDPEKSWAVESTWSRYVNPSPGPLSPYTRISDAVLEQDGSGAVYLAGMAPPPLGGSFVTKLDADGVVVWHTVILPLQIELPMAAALSPSGELFVAGGTLRQVGATSFGQEDAYVMKLDKATGAVIWAAQAGGPDPELATALGFDAAGNVYLAGTTLGSVAPGVANRGAGDLFAVEIDADGQVVSSWQAGTAGDDEVTSMVVTPAGEVFVGGFTSGDLVAANRHAGSDDMFIIKAALTPSANRAR